MLVKLKEKGQITIPVSLREQIDALQGDMFEIKIINGNIVLKPQDIVSRKLGKKKKPIDISPWIGSGKGLFETPDDVDAFIRSERDQWE